MSLIRELFEFVRPPNERERPVALVWFVDNPTMNLEPIEPETAVELYLDGKKLEVRRSTIRSHRSRLGNFVRWCDKQDIVNCNELTGRLVHQYRVWRRNDGELNAVSVKTEMDTLRVFIRWLGTIRRTSPSGAGVVSTSSGWDTADDTRNASCRYPRSARRSIGSAPSL